MTEDLQRTKYRVESIDVLRGLVMIIMALDHVRDNFHITAATDNPLNLATTTPLLYFTRWITHFCAPVFVFLSGTSIYLQSQRKSKKELSAFLIKRGIWLIVVELVVISFAWSFNPFYDYVFLQVIWAIGWSMIILGLLIYLPFNFILTLGLVIVFGHNFLDYWESSPGFKHTFWIDLLHSAKFSQYKLFGNHTALIVYPLIAWSGLMMLGYCAGVWFTNKVSIERRRKILMRMGSALILLFVVVRFINVYGDPVAWKVQKDNFNTFLSFIDVNKYPPSLLYLSITIGLALIFLALIEKTRNGFTRVNSVFGRVAFFYYVIHLFLIHILTTIAFFSRGHSWSEGVFTNDSIFPFYFLKPGEGYNLAVVYTVWAGVILILYPLCKRYDEYKTRHKEKWWLSYL